jgi:hypothetical protein
MCTAQGSWLAPITSTNHGVERATTIQAAAKDIVQRAFFYAIAGFTFTPGGHRGGFKSLISPKNGWNISGGLRVRPVSLTCGLTRTTLSSCPSFRLTDRYREIPCAQIVPRKFRPPESEFTLLRTLRLDLPHTIPLARRSQASLFAFPPLQDFLVLDPRPAQQTPAGKDTPLTFP